MKQNSCPKVALYPYVEESCVVNECSGTPPQLAGDRGDYPNGSRNEQNQQEQGCQDESVLMISSKASETDQNMDGSQLLKDNSEDQGVRPPQINISDGFHEWITVADEDANSATTTPEDKSARTLTYLKEAQRFGKRAGDYKTAWRVVEGLRKMSRIEVEAVKKAINAQASIEFADLSNDYYRNANQNGEAEIFDDVEDKGQEGRIVEG